MKNFYPPNFPPYGKCYKKSLQITFLQTSELLLEINADKSPYNQTVVDMLLEEVDNIANRFEQDHSRFPMELQTIATFILETVNYLLTGVENTTFEDATGQVSFGWSICSSLLSNIYRVN